MVTLTVSRLPRRTRVMTLLAFLLVFFNVYLLVSDVGEPASLVGTPPVTPREGGAALGQRDMFEDGAPVLTIFTILRDLTNVTSLYEGDYRDQSAWLEALHTHNALGSWMQLPHVNIIAYGEADACAFFASYARQHPGVQCLPVPCYHEELGAPRYDCLFADAAERAQTPFLMYSNSDIVYFDDVLLALRDVAERHEDFVMVGQRRDLLWPHPLDFSSRAWAPRFRAIALRYGALHGRYGIDYFVQRTSRVRALPPFVVGRVRWDNWLLAQYIGNQSAVAIDCTSVLLAVHLNHMRVGDSHLRNGTDYNIGLVKNETVDPKKIGDISSCDWRLEPSDPLASAPADGAAIGACPQCTFVRNRQNLDVVLYKNAELATRNIIIATVNSGYLDFALNWMCSLRRIGLKHFLFHAVDEPMYERLFAMGLPVILYESAMAADFKRSAAANLSSSYLSEGEPAYSYGSVAYQSVMNARTEFIYKALQKGYNILLSDVDNVFLRDPFRFLARDLDVQGGVHKQTKVTGGFLYLRATDATLRVWIKVLLRHRDIFAKMQQQASFDPHAMTEQELLNAALISDKQITWAALPPSVVADGKRFFIDKQTQRNGEWPAVIHNNWIVGVDLKRERFRNVSLWLIDDAMRCRPMPADAAAIEAAQPPRATSLSLVIKVLAYNRPDALARLLASLARVDFAGDAVALDIFIDAPAGTDGDGDAAAAAALCRQSARVGEQFAWPHGAKRVVARTLHAGLLGQWLGAWFPTSDGQLAWFLEDDNVVSPAAYRFIRAAAHRFYFDGARFDPRLFGVALQSQHVIPGSYPDRPRDRLPAGTRFYRYQLLSTWGPVFFPRVWADFVTWHARVAAAQADFVPLVSNLITNEWYLQRGGGRSVWSAWFLRYAAERGLYALYTNFEENAALVVNYRDKGVNYLAAQGPNSPLLEQLAPKHLDFPESNQEIPLYDFHFNRIEEDPVVLEGRAHYADIYNVETH